MPRNTAQEDEVEFVDEIPIKAGGGTRWAQILVPLTRSGGIGRPALVKTCATPEQAQDAQGNLSKRNVRIPQPDGDWSFYSRGCEVYAIFRGAVKKRANARTVPKTRK